MKIILWGLSYLDIKTTIRMQKTHYKNFWWEHIKNKSYKSFLGNREQKAVFLVVSQLVVHFGTIFCMPNWVHK